MATPADTPGAVTADTPRSAARDVADGDTSPDCGPTSAAEAAWVEQGVQCTGWVRASARSDAPAGSS